jgi:hypothetical protein
MSLDELLSMTCTQQHSHKYLAHFLSPSWIFLCFVTSYGLLNLRLQTSHSNGRFSLWLSLWLLSSFFDTHSLPHNSHLYCLLLWQFMWIFNFAFVLNCKPQRTQMCGSFMCIFLWSSISSVEKNSPLTLHICTCSLLKTDPPICKTCLSLLFLLLPSLYK